MTDHRALGIKRLREIAGGYSAIHDAETVPMAEEILILRARLQALGEKLPRSTKAG